MYTTIFETLLFVLYLHIHLPGSFCSRVFNADIPHSLANTEPPPSRRVPDSLLEYVRIMVRFNDKRGCAVSAHLIIVAFVETIDNDQVRGGKESCTNPGRPARAFGGRTTSSFVWTSMFRRRSEDSLLPQR